MNHDLGAYTLQIAILMGTGYRFEIKLTMLWVHWILSLDPYRHRWWDGEVMGRDGKRWEEIEVWFRTSTEVAVSENRVPPMK
jgi:hypothetical protein